MSNNAKAKRRKLIKFAVFCGSLMGQWKPAVDFDDLLKNRMTKKQQENWEAVEYIDDQGRKIHITREFFDYSHWDLDDVIEDWIEHNPEQLDAEIIAIK